MPPNPFLGILIGGLFIGMRSVTVLGFSLGIERGTCLIPER
jgi:hypothetical protein